MRTRTCHACGGEGMPLGKFGRLIWYCCRQCGMQFHSKEN